MVYPEILGMIYTHSLSPWGVNCAIIRHFVEIKELKYKEITDSLQINVTLQSLMLYNIRDELGVFENAVSSVIKCKSFMKEQIVESFSIFHYCKYHSYISANPTINLSN